MAKKKPSKEPNIAAFNVLQTIITKTETVTAPVKKKAVKK